MITDTKKTLNTTDTGNCVNLLLAITKRWNFAMGWRLPTISKKNGNNTEQLQITKMLGALSNG